MIKLTAAITISDEHMNATLIQDNIRRISVIKYFYLWFYQLLSSTGYWTGQSWLKLDYCSDSFNWLYSSELNCVFKLVTSQLVT